MNFWNDTMVGKGLKSAGQSALKAFNQNKTTVLTVAGVLMVSMNAYAQQKPTNEKVKDSTKKPKPVLVIKSNDTIINGVKYDKSELKFNSGKKVEQRGDTLVITRSTLKKIELERKVRKEATKKDVKKQGNKAEANKKYTERWKKWAQDNNATPEQVRKAQQEENEKWKKYLESKNKKNKNQEVKTEKTDENKSKENDKKTIKEEKIEIETIINNPVPFLVPYAVAAPEKAQKIPVEDKMNFYVGIGGTHEVFQQGNINNYNNNGFYFEAGTIDLIRESVVSADVYTRVRYHQGNPERTVHAPEVDCDNCDQGPARDYPYLKEGGNDYINLEVGGEINVNFGAGQYDLGIDEEKFDMSKLRTYHKYEFSGGVFGGLGYASYIGKNLDGTDANLPGYMTIGQEDNPYNDNTILVDENYSATPEQVDAWTQKIGAHWGVKFRAERTFGKPTVMAELKDGTKMSYEDAMNKFQNNTDMIQNVEVKQSGFYAAVEGKMTWNTRPDGYTRTQFNNTVNGSHSAYFNGTRAEVTGYDTVNKIKVQPTISVAVGFRF